MADKLDLDALEHDAKSVPSGSCGWYRETHIALIEWVRELERVLQLIESGSDARGYELSIDGMKSLARYALKGKK